jgi:carboxynorspermidine decarboxylase
MFFDLDPYSVPSPCYVVDVASLRSNLAVLDLVQKKTGAKILLALKGFAMHCLAGEIMRVLHGTAASSLDEARLGREEFGGEVHITAPAFREDEFGQILQLADHIVFNSFSQWQRFSGQVNACKKPLHCAIRVNPEHREVETAIYDPCGPGSRLGVVQKNFRGDLLGGISGLHFHTLCEKNADALARTLPVFEEKFGPWLKQMSWVNFGGGHHITRPDYDVDLLCRLLNDFAGRRKVEVYLEPGEAIALNTGVFVASVLDITANDMPIAILDTSAAAHMPDVLEMPYRPQIAGADMPGAKPYTFRLAGMTCLAGDVIGEYSFDRPLNVGDRLVFGDMAHYTMVKNNTFNGIRLPGIAVRGEDGSTKIVRTFSYEDFKGRLC